MADRLFLLNGSAYGSRRADGMLNVLIMVTIGSLYGDRLNCAVLQCTKIRHSQNIITGNTSMHHFQRLCHRNTVFSLLLIVLVRGIRQPVKLLHVSCFTAEDQRIDAGQL